MGDLPEKSAQSEVDLLGVALRSMFRRFGPALSACNLAKIWFISSSRIGIDVNYQLAFLGWLWHRYCEHLKQWFIFG